MKIKICIKCKTPKDISEFYTHTKYSGGTYYPTSSCKECEKVRTSREYFQYKKERKTTAVEYRGGACCKCGYNRCLSALEFHHRDPSQKDPKITQFCRRRLTEKAKVELDKCDLYCANCHRELHEDAKTNGRKKQEG